jgi:hypothetical protein
MFAARPGNIGESFACTFRFLEGRDIAERDNTDQSFLLV